MLHPDDNGTFVAYVPAIAGCHAWGQTSDAAQAELIQVFEMIHEEYQEAGQELPKNVEVTIGNTNWLAEVTVKSFTAPHCFLTVQFVQ